MQRQAPITLDIVIPLYNEEAVIPLLVRQLEETFTPAALREHGIGRVRFLAIDDGSTDRSAHLICEHIRRGVPFVLVRLTRNFGHQSAVSAGLDQADADVVAVMDADMQDPPELIPQLIAKWREGFDVVYAQRRKRKENALKRFGYWAFYRFVAFMSEIQMPLDSGDFCLMDRRVVSAMKSLPEKLRFPRGLRAWVGFRQTGIEYERPARPAGFTKYTWLNLYRLATDGIASSSIRPLKATQLFSFTFAVLTVILLVVFLILLFTVQANRMLLVLFLITYIMIAGVSFAISSCLYILAAYIGRGYLEIKGRPSYLVMEVVGPDSAAEDKP